MNKTLYIEFKTKTFPVVYPDGTKREVVRLKKQLTRIDCNLNPSDHDYYNSDLFPGLLMGAYRKVIGTREFCYLDELPDGLSVDTSKFLAVVRIPLVRNFRR